MVENTTTATVMIRPDEDSDNFSYQKALKMSTATKKEIDRVADEYGFESQSQAYRYFLTIGAMAVPKLDPRNEDTIPNSQDDDYHPLTLRDILPETPEEAKDIRDEVIEDFADEVLDEVINDPQINKDGWNAWVENEGV